MAKSTMALQWLLAGLDNPDSQDPAGFGREDVSEQLLSVVGNYKDLVKLHSYLHSPDYNRAELARRLRALKGLL